MVINKQTIKQEYDYVLLEERKEKSKTTFKIKALSKKQLARLEDKLFVFNQEDGSVNLANTTYLVEAFKLGVVDISNLKDEKGKDIVVEKINDIITDEFIELFPIEVITEIGAVITNITKSPNDIDIYLG